VADATKRDTQGQRRALGNDSGEQSRLVIAARASPIAVQDRGHDDVQGDANREIARDARRDQRAELVREGALATVLEPVDGLTEGAAVRARGGDLTVPNGLAQLAASQTQPAARGATAGAARREEQVERGVRGRSGDHAGSKTTSSPACVLVAAAVPAGSSMTSAAPRATTAVRHGLSRSATRTTRPARSTNTASIGKRMSHIVIEDVFVIRRPSPGRRLERGIRPSPREKNEAATRQSVARTVPLVMLRTRRREAWT